jgi:uncharacterized surface protein with fasciclin (FAS1) repeats
MKSAKIMMAMIVAVIFVFAVAAYAQEAAAEKAAQAQDVKDSGGSKVETPPAAPVDAAKQAEEAKESKEARAEEKAAERTDIKEGAESKPEGTAATPVSAGQQPADAEQAKETKAEEKAAEKTDREERAAEREGMVEKQDIVATLDAGAYKTLAKALETAGLVETLKGKGPYTLLAPDDAAFAKLPEGKLDALMKDKAQLAALLKKHVIAGEVTYEQLKAMKEVKTLGGTLKLAVKEGALMIGDAKVGTGEKKCANGIIIPVQAVLQ